MPRYMVRYEIISGHIRTHNDAVEFELNFVDLNSVFFSPKFVVIKSLRDHIVDRIEVSDVYGIAS
jgi:hypothetical protein